MVYLHINLKDSFRFWPRISNFYNSFRIFKYYRFNFRLVLTNLTLLFFVSSLLFIPLSILIPKQLVQAVDCNGSNFTITRKSSPIHYRDMSTTPNLTGMYYAYQITNNTGGILSDVWVQIEGIDLSAIVQLAPTEDGLQSLGSLANAEAKYVYFYFVSSAATAVGQAHDVVVYDTVPSLAPSPVCQSTFSVTSEETIKAEANKVDTVVTTPSPPELGGIITMTVTGSTGTIGNADIFAYTPAAFPDWPADAYQLLDTRIVMTGGNNATFDDILFLNSLNNQDTDYTLTYKFAASGITNAPTSVSPVNYISSGTQIKHTSTDTTTYQALPPIQPADNHTKIDSKTVSPTHLPTGGTATYTVTFSNAGAEEVYLDFVTDVLPTSPATVTYVADTSLFNGVSIIEPHISGSTLSWIQLLAIPGGATRVLEYQVTFPTTEGIYTNSVTAMIGSSVIDMTVLPTGPTVPATSNFAVGALADLSITKTGSPKPVFSGDDLTYTITVTNDGPDSAENISVADTLPESLTYVSATPSQGSCDIISQDLTCSIGTISAAANATINLVTNVVLGTTGNIANSSTVSSSTNDNDSANNSSTDNTTAITITDLSVVKSDSTDPVIAGEQFSFEMTVTNNGPNNATNVVLSDDLPLGITFSSYLSSQGSCIFASGNFSCALGTIPNGDFATVTLVVDSNPSQIADISNTVDVDMDQDDSNLTDNSDTEVTSFEQNYDLAVNISTVNSSENVNTEFDFTILATNYGPSSVANAIVIFTFPSEIELVSFLTNQGSCVLTTILTCEMGEVSVSETVTITITAKGIQVTTGAVDSDVEINPIINETNILNNSDSSSMSYTEPPATPTPTPTVLPTSTPVPTPMLTATPAPTTAVSPTPTSIPVLTATPTAAPENEFQFFPTATPDIEPTLVLTPTPTEVVAVPTQVLKPTFNTESPGTSDEKSSTLGEFIVTVTKGIGILGLLGSFGVIIFILNRRSHPVGLVIGTNGLTLDTKIEVAKALGIKYYRIRDINLSKIFKNEIN